MEPEEQEFSTTWEGLHGVRPEVCMARRHVLTLARPKVVQGDTLGQARRLGGIVSLASHGGHLGL